MEFGRVLVFSLILLATTTLFFNFHVDEVDSVKGLEGCENFNSKDFFLTGGSLKASNVEEAQYILARNNWLCNGGSWQR